MDRKQKEKLRFLLKARKRADKVLAKRREAERKKLEHDQRMQANQALVKEYTRQLTALAQDSGILSLAEQAALQRGGSLSQAVSCYIHYGLSSSSLQHATGVGSPGELRASHLALRIIWKNLARQKKWKFGCMPMGPLPSTTASCPYSPSSGAVARSCCKKCLPMH